MRLPVPRLTAALAILIALVTALGPAGPRNGRDRDRVARTTRAGALRLDASDSAIQLHDDELTLLPAAPAPGQHPTASPPPSPSGAAPPDSATVEPPLDVVAGGTPTATPPPHTHALDPHAPDRAPPA